MASASPVSSSKIGDSITTIAAINGNTTLQRPGPFEMPKQSLRGLNKPKCIKCGNVARSRNLCERCGEKYEKRLCKCPFQSCKSCCAKAENPCHIHVLKHNGTLPDKPPTSSSSPVEQPSNEAFSSSGPSWRLNSLRQLSANFSSILRTKKPLTRKDAMNINRWRFMKLKEHFEGNIEVENEAFDRYMQNVDMLEETFSIMEQSQPDNLVSLDDISSEKVVSEIKMKLKADSERADKFRDRIKTLLDNKLLELLKAQTSDDDYSTYDEDLDDDKELKRSKKIMKSRFDRNAIFDDLVYKLNRAQNKEDLASCLDMKLQLASNSSPCENLLKPKQESESVAALSFHSVHKMWTPVPVDQDTLGKIDTEFSSLGQIALL